LDHGRLAADWSDPPLRDRLLRRPQDRRGRRVDVASRRVPGVLGHRRGHRPPAHLRAAHRVERGPAGRARRRRDLVDVIAGTDWGVGAGAASLAKPQLERAALKHLEALRPPRPPIFHPRADVLERTGLHRRIAPHDMRPPAHQPQALRGQPQSPRHGVRGPGESWL
jgi:hypothetical protein